VLYMLQENCDYFSEKGSKCLNIEDSIVATRALIEEIPTSKLISHCAMLGDSSLRKGKEDAISAILDEKVANLYKNSKFKAMQEYLFDLVLFLK
jgi:hypothetical protein